MDNLQQEIVELARHLHQERLFVSSERQHLQALNEKVLKGAEKLFHLAWITGQQRNNLDVLISRPECSPATCSSKAAALEDVRFMDGHMHKQLGANESLYGEFLQSLRENPRLLATCLAAADKLNVENFQPIINTVLASLYCYSALPEDEVLVLRLLKHLAELQLATVDSPKWLFQRGTCAFSRLYKSFSEGLFTSKLFLTAALHEPIMQLLMDDETYLEIDVSQSVFRLSAEDRLKRLGSEDVPNYASRVRQYHQLILDKLVSLMNILVDSLKQTMHCFPASLSWLVRQMAQVLLAGGHVSAAEVRAACTDLIFSLFICPAIVNPEPYGIVDAPISSVARFNLMQVAQFLQVLAVDHPNDSCGKWTELYSHFGKDCLSVFVDSMLEGQLEEEPSLAAVPGASSFPTRLNRSAALIQDHELFQLVSLFRTLQNETTNKVDKKALASLLATLPQNSLPARTNVMTNNSNGSLAASDSSHIIDVNSTTPETMKRSILSKVSRTRSRVLASGDSIEENSDHRKQQSDSENNSPTNDTVLVISFPNSRGDYIGLLSEQKVLSMLQQGKNRVRMNLDDVHTSDETDGANGAAAGETIEKRTRFSLSHDEGSIGNTSDNLEAVSEAASNHSVASSLELENEDQNDNLSDMISANVSGRGTPNVSGRDTPSSQVTEGEEAAQRGGAAGERRPLDLPVNHPKQSRSDIEDKFGKFEFKPLMEGDETVSMVSDSWSTDVLASDYEPLALEQIERPEPPAPVFPLAPTRQLSDGGTGILLDISETASEAWSMDVVASDSDRLGDVDTDDTSSVARSDDTARSEVEVEVPPADNLLRPDPEGADFAASVGNVPSSALFRPIREEGLNRGTLPPPLRIDAAVSRSPERRLEMGEHASFDEVDSCVSGSGSSRRDSNTSLSRLDTLNASSAAREWQKSHFPYPRGGLANANWARCPVRMQTLGQVAADGLPPDSPRSIESFSRISSSARSLPVLGAAAVGSAESLGALCSPLPVRTASEEETAFPVSPPAVYARSERRLRSLGGEKQDSLQETDMEAPIIQLSLGGSESCITVGNGPVKVHANHLSKGASLGDNGITLNRTLKPPSETVDTVEGASAASTSNVDRPSTAASGAIPKSISFDKTAERDWDSMEEDGKHKHKPGFFRSLKLPFKGRNRKLMRGPQDDGARGSSKSYSYSSVWNSEYVRTDGHEGRESARMRKSLSEDAQAQSNNSETSDDILAKYRCKASTVEESSTVTFAMESISSNATLKGDDYVIDPQNVEASYAFADAKRKLRLVLSTTDLHGVLGLCNATTPGSETASQENPLLKFLRLQLAEAINLQDRSLVAQLHETLRCMQLFDDEGCRKLFCSLKEEYKKRTSYVAYLVRCRQGLLATLNHIEKLMERLEQDRAMCNRFLVAVCVRLFMERHDGLLQSLISEFQHLTAADEKTDLVERFLQEMNVELARDAMWQGCPAQLQQAQSAVEQAVMCQIYIHALYPNGEADISRDQVLHDHMKKLSKVITPNHKDLRIPKTYHYECPWPSAQAEITAVNAYKMPKDKLQCVLRCCLTIVNLLSMAWEKGIPAADDIMPVLVYVLVKANPPALLSTVQYVNSFYGSRMEGEEQYYWTQFCSAVEFIKTMDYAV